MRQAEFLKMEKEKEKEKGGRCSLPETTGRGGGVGNRGGCVAFPLAYKVIRSCCPGKDLEKTPEALGASQDSKPARLSWGKNMAGTIRLYSMKERKMKW